MFYVIIVLIIFAFSILLKYINNEKRSYYKKLDRWRKRNENI